MKPADTFDVFVGSNADNAHIGIENWMYGYRGNDHLIFTGGLNSTTILAGRGDDTLRGDIGADYLYGGRGRDTLIGLGGNDQLYGGKGADTFVIPMGTEHTIKDYQPGKDTIVLLDA